MIAIAKMVIGWRWKNSNKLLVEEWWYKLWEYYVMEIITYCVDARSSPRSCFLFTGCWFSLLEYLKRKKEIPAAYDFLDFTLF